MKTSNLLKTSLGVLLTTIVIMGIVEFIENKKLKTCESRQSFRCPRLTCSASDDLCGYRPWICDPASKNNDCVNNKICIGYCSSSEKNKCYA